MRAADTVIDGDRIRLLREALDWSQSELARRSGVDQGTVSKIESGEVKNPGIDSIFKLMAALKTPVEHIRSGAAPALAPAPALAHDAVMADLIRATVHETLAQLLVSPSNRDERSELIAVLVAPGKLEEPGASIREARRRRTGKQGIES
jgi:transcriptional regulator with XRE-family HTH domain